MVSAESNLTLLLWRSCHEVTDEVPSHILKPLQCFHEIYLTSRVRTLCLPYWGI
jgi:hypothetical protein